MDDETKKIIIENYSLNKENNEIIKKLYKIQRFNQMIRIVYWVIIVLVAIGALYFIQPFFDSLLSVYGLDSSSINNILK